jgi:hypothetical protein
VKKNAVITLTILVMLFDLLGKPLLPVSSALAKEGGQIYLYIRNRTGGHVKLSLTDKTGKKTVFDYNDGLYKERLNEGVYTYHFITPCGSEAGKMNLNVNKQLYFSCATDAATIGALSVQARGTCDLMLRATLPNGKIFYVSFRTPNTDFEKYLVKEYKGQWLCYDNIAPIYYFK